MARKFEVIADGRTISRHAVYQAAFEAAERHAAEFLPPARNVSVFDGSRHVWIAHEDDAD